MQYLANLLSMHEIRVADYYYRRGDYVASINRAQTVLKDYPETPATQNALVDMVKSYDRLGMDKLRDDAKRVLDKTYPQWNKKVISTQKKLPWWQFWE